MTSTYLTAFQVADKPGEKEDVPLLQILLKSMVLGDSQGFLNSSKAHPVNDSVRNMKSYDQLTFQTGARRSEQACKQFRRRRR